MLNINVISKTDADGKPIFVGRAVYNGTVETDSLVADIASQTKLSSEQIGDVLTALTTCTKGYLLSGKVLRINGLAEFKYRASCKLDSADAALSQENTEISVHIQADEELSGYLTQHAQMERSQGKVPVIESLRDKETDSPDTCKPGSLLELSGKNLKFNSKDKDEGVFITDGSGKEKRLSVYMRQTQKGVVAQMPLEPNLSGEFELTVKARFGDDEIRSSLPYPITVQALTE